MQQVKPWIALAVVTAIACVGNLLLPGVFYRARYSLFNENMAFTAAGALVAQGCLLAIWAALGSQSVVARLPITFGLLALATSCYVIGLQFPDDSLPIDLALVIVAGAILLYGCIQVPLWVVRIYGRVWIDAVNSPPRGSTMRTQFGMRYLLGLTAAVGFLIVMFREALPDSGVVLDDLLPAVALTMLLFAIFSALVCVPCIWMALGRRFTIWWVILLLVVFLIGSPVVLVATNAILDVTTLPEYIAGMYAFSLGVVGGILAVLGSVRWLGFHLTSMPALGEHSS